MKIRHTLVVAGMAAILGGCIVHPYPPAHRDHDGYYGYDDDYYDYRSTPSYEGYFYVRIIFIGGTPYYVDDNRYVRPIPPRLHDHFRHYPYQTLRRPPAFSRDTEVRDGYAISRIVYLDGVPYAVDNSRTAQPLPERLQPHFRSAPVNPARPPQPFGRQDNGRNDEAPAYGREQDRARDRDRADRPPYGRTPDDEGRSPNGRMPNRDDRPPYGRAPGPQERGPYDRMPERGPDDRPPFGRAPDRDERSPNGQMPEPGREQMRRNDRAPEDREREPERTSQPPFGRDTRNNAGRSPVQIQQQPAAFPDRREQPREDRPAAQPAPADDNRGSRNAAPPAARDSEKSRAADDSDRKNGDQKNNGKKSRSGKNDEQDDNGRSGKRN